MVYTILFAIFVPITITIVVSAFIEAIAVYALVISLIAKFV